MTDRHFDYLDALRKSSGLTHQQISDASGVPVGTVSRIFSRQTTDPSFTTVSNMVVAMNGSLDEFATGNRNEAKTSDMKCGEYFDRALEASRSAYQNAYNCIQKQHEVELERVKQYLLIKDRWLRLMFIYCIALTSIMAIISVVRQ